MQEFFFTLVSIWFLWKLFDAFSSKGRTASQQEEPRKREGDVNVNSSASPKTKIPPSEGEYVDYEEIK